jgi:hypothetical protein
MARRLRAPLARGFATSGKCQPPARRRALCAREPSSGMPAAARMRRRVGRRCRVVILKGVPANAHQRRPALLIPFEIAGGWAAPGVNWSWRGCRPRGEIPSISFCSAGGRFRPTGANSHQCQMGRVIGVDLTRRRVGRHRCLGPSPARRRWLGYTAPAMRPAITPTQSTVSRAKPRWPGGCAAGTPIPGSACGGPDDA